MLDRERSRQKWAGQAAHESLPCGVVEDPEHGQDAVRGTVGAADVGALGTDVVDRQTDATWGIGSRRGGGTAEGGEVGVRATGKNRHAPGWQGGDSYCSTGQGISYFTHNKSALAPAC